MADPLLRLVTHPLAVGADVGGQSLGALPAADPGFGEAGEHRRLVAELGRDLDQRLVDQHRDRIEVRGVGFEAEPLRLQGNGAAAGERVEDGRRIAVGGFQDLGVRLREQLLVADVLPDHQLLDQPVQPLPLGALGFLGGELVGPRGRVVHQLREQYSPRRCQRTPGPPQMQGGRVPVPDRLLSRRLAVNRLQRQRDFDQLPPDGWPGVGHSLSLTTQHVGL